MELKNVKEENILIDDIPALVLTPNNDVSLHPTIVFYHGWSSSHENQRFRGYILASLGYQVVIPCAIYHGSRNPVDHRNPEVAGRYFWDVILKNIEEFKKISEYTVSRLSADPDRIGVCGNSMGGFTTAGIFTCYESVKAAVVFNGSCNWNYSNTCFLNALNFNAEDFPKDLQESIDKFNPMNNLESIIDRPLLMLHGDSDSLVDIEAQRQFFKKVSPLYRCSERLKFIEYPKLNHFVTTNMIEEAAIWFGEYL